MQTKIASVVEIPELLHDAVQVYLENNPDMDSDRVMAAALSLFLLQNYDANSKEIAKAYLESRFQPAREGGYIGLR